MSQPRKRKTGVRAADTAASPEAGKKERTGRRRTIIIAFIILAIIGIIIGVGHYVINVRPFQHTIIIVGDESVNMREFLKRARLYGLDDPHAILEVIVEELLIEQGAPRYGIEVTEKDIDEGLREGARGESESITDLEFNEWYRQRLNESGLSDAEYREAIRRSLLRAHLHVYLAKRVPTVTEQVHFHIIMVGTYEEAEEVRARWEAGEDFADLAREVSLDETAKEKGGDVGWIPYGVLEDTYAWVISNLDIGEVSTPIRAVSADPSAQSEQAPFLLFMVSEKTIAREVDEEYMPVLQIKALDDWLLLEMSVTEIKFQGFKKKGQDELPGFDTYTYNWIILELSKMKR